jgi:hypothetical protein
MAVLFTIISLLPADGWALSIVPTRGDLGGNEFIDWAVLGPTGTKVINSFLTSANGGLDITVSMPTGQFFERHDQGSTWLGNFAPGDALIFTFASTGPISLLFDTPIFGVGAQIQTPALGPFTGFITAFDTNNATLGSFSLNGSSTTTVQGGGDNSAIFLGLRDTTASISRIEFGANQEGAPSNFAINRLDIVTSTNQLPEPSSLLLLGLGLAGLAVWRRKHAA